MSMIKYIYIKKILASNPALVNITRKKYVDFYFNTKSSVCYFLRDNLLCVCSALLSGTQEDMLNHFLLVEDWSMEHKGGVV